MSIENKIKDSKPEATVRTIKNILKEKMDLTLSEDIDEPVTNCFSARVFINKTPIGANGKGTNELFALASAYGEFMERIQNNIMFQLTFDIAEYESMSNDFLYSPDEKYYDIKDYEKDYPEYYDKYILPHYNIHNDKKIIVQPFYNLRKDRIDLLPPKIINILHGTNGMCAGNSKSEALVQGISEIIERNVMFSSFQEKLTFKTISGSVLKKTKYINEMIKDIRNKDYLELQVKEAENIFGIPVICTALINKEDATYYIRWGAHINRSIAIERSITELFQRWNLNNIKDIMVPFSFCEPLSKENMRNAFKTGAAHYPGTFFFSNIEHLVVDNKNDSERYDNDILLKVLLNIFNKYNCDVLARDVSFLGFPSYRIIIPGISEIVPNSRSEIAKINNSCYFIIRNILLRLDSFTINELKNELEKLDIEDINMNANAAGYLRLPPNNSSQLNKLPIGLFTALLFLISKDYQRSYDTLSKMIKSYPSRLVTENLKFHRCLRDAIGCLKEGIPLSDIKNYLLPFYTEKLIDKASILIRNSGVFLKTSFNYTCWDCSVCAENTRCAFNSTKIYYEKAKLWYKKNTPCQENLKDIKMSGL